MIQIGKCYVIASVSVCSALVGYLAYRCRKQEPEEHDEKKVLIRNFLDKLEHIIEQNKCRHNLHNLNDPIDCKRYVTKKVLTGNHYFLMGDYDKGLDCLLLALSVSTKPVELFQCFSKYLEPDIFQMLLKKIMFTL